MYGYIRVVDSVNHLADAHHIQRELAEHAERAGFNLDRLFTDSVMCAESAFSSMVDELRRHGVRNVIVPTLWHFARLPGLQAAMRQHIEHEVGARIWVIQGMRQ
jgi:hypothetical protein